MREGVRTPRKPRYRLRRRVVWRDRARWLGRVRGRTRAAIGAVGAVLLTLAGSAAAREAVRASGASLAHRASCARSWRSRCAAIIARCSCPIQSVGVAVGALSVSEGWTLGAHLVVGAVVRVGGGVAVGVLFEEGEVGLVDDNDDRSVVEVVVMVVLFLPSPSLLLVSFLVVLLDCIDTTEGLIVFCVRLRVLWN